MNLFYYRMDTSRLVSFQALSTLKQHQALFIDLRDSISFQQFHLPDFVNYPYTALQIWQKTLPKNKPICFLCEHGQTAYEVAMSLYAKGYDAYAFSQGIEQIKKVPLKNDTYW